MPTAQAIEQGTKLVRFGILLVLGMGPILVLLLVLLLPLLGLGAGTWLRVPPGLSPSL